MNPYKSYPKCPSCETRGPLTANGTRKCANDRCEVQLYWYGGSTTNIT